MALSRVAYGLAAIAFLVALVPGPFPASAATEGPPAEPADVLVTVDSVPTGRSVILGLGLRTTPFTFTCVTGTTRNMSVPSPQTIGETRHLFTGWSDGYPNNGMNRTIDCDVAASNYTAVFETEHWLAITSNPVGRRIVVDAVAFDTPVALWCADGSTVSVVVPSPQVEFGSRHTFTNWSDGGSANRAIPCTGPIDLLAGFRTEYFIAVFTSPTGIPVTLDGNVSLLSPVTFWCGEGEERFISVPIRVETEDGTFTFATWEDGSPDPFRVIHCGRTLNVSAVYTREPGPGTGSTPPPSLPVLGILVAVVTIAAGVALGIVARRPTGPPLAARACPSCASVAPPDWVYCASCGADLSPPGSLGH